MSAADPSKNNPQFLTNPIRKAFAIAPNDAADVAVVPRAILVATNGVLKVTMADDDDAAPQLLPLVAGVWQPMQVKRVWATGNTCGNIFGGL